MTRCRRFPLLAAAFLLLSATALPAQSGETYFPSRHDWEHRSPDSAFVFLGSGVNMVYVDREHDLVIVGRWISDYGAMDGLIRRVLDAIDD